MPTHVKDFLIARARDVDVNLAGIFETAIGMLAPSSPLPCPRCFVVERRTDALVATGAGGETEQLFCPHCETRFVVPAARVI